MEKLKHHMDIVQLMNCPLRHLIRKRHQIQIELYVEKIFGSGTVALII